MNAGDNKLRALQKRISLQEDQLLRERNRIDEVVKSRSQVVDEFRRQESEISDRLTELRTKKRRSALQSGDGVLLAGISAFEARVTKELRDVLGRLAESEGELRSAVERLELADAELLSVRLEKKRMEKLLDSRELTERVRNVALEEALADEMNTYRRPKRDV